MIYVFPYAFRFTIYSTLYEINHKSEFINKRLADYNFFFTEVVTFGITHASMALHSLDHNFFPVHDIYTLLHLLYATASEVVDECWLPTVFCCHLYVGGFIVAEADYQ